MCWACVLVLSVTAGACGDGGTDPQLSVGTVAGRVLVGSTAVQGAELELVAVGSRSTDADGQYRFENVAQGEHTLVLTWPGGLKLPLDRPSTTPVTVRAGEVETVDWSLEPVGIDDPVEVRLTALFTFNPASLTIPAGTTVRWVNEAPFYHTVTPEDAGQPGVWERQTTDSRGVVFQHRFGVPGEVYRYACEPHSFGFTSGMVGEVHVQ